MQQFFDQYDFQNATQRIEQWNFINSYRLSFQYEVNQTYQSQTQTFSTARQLKTSKTQLQIIADSSKEFAFSSKSNLFRLTENFIFRLNQSVQNQEEYECSDRFFEKAWNQRNSWNNQERVNIYNRDKTQEAYTDAIEKNDDVNNSRNYQNQKRYQNSNSNIFLIEINKKNENSHHIEDDLETFDQDQKYSYFLNENEYHISIEMIDHTKSLIHQCRRCKKIFSSNNKLHRHIRECRSK